MGRRVRHRTLGLWSDRRRTTRGQNHPGLSIEASVGFSEPGHMSGASGHMGAYAASMLDGERGALSLAYEGNLLYEFTSSRWAPYLTGGVGAFTTWPENGGAWTDPAANFGVGIKFYAQPRVALRLDLREYLGSFTRFDEVTGAATRGLGGHPQVTAGVGFGL